ncbi:hypothetical protein OJ998_11660 [Solirubrobacter taibaiensis]|nr:hypothetical protein [Solirubrobacter taibaiensis]
MGDRFQDVRWMDGVWFALLVAFVAAAERLDRARATIVNYDNVDRLWFEWGWFVIAAAGTFVAVMSARKLVDRANDLADEHNDAREVALPWLLGLTIALWSLWQMLGALIVAGVFEQQLDLLRTALHVGAVIVGCVAVGWAGGTVPGNATRAWKDASVVRLQLIVLATLLALVLFAPIAADQSLDVLRAWGDGQFTRAVLGVVGALLLGSICRASVVLLVVPEDGVERPPEPAGVERPPPSSGRRPRRSFFETLRAARNWVWALMKASWPRLKGAAWWAEALLILAGALIVFGLLPLGVALASVVLLLLATKGTAPYKAAHEESVHRFAGTLSIVPLAILLAGLASAFMDTLLLVSGPTSTDVALGLCTLAVAVLLAVCTALHDPSTWKRKPKPEGSESPKYPARILAATGLLGAVAVGFPDALAGVPMVVGCVLLVVVVLALASGWPLTPGRRTLWVGVAVVTGTGIALYADPVLAARTYGAFALIFIGTTGILLIAHLAGAVGARRTFRVNWAWLPGRAPIVSLFAVWIVAAFLSADPVTHQARTDTTSAKPQSLQAATTRWLEAQAANPVGPAEDRYVPMLFIAASGGGSKAAYWTDLVVDCLLSSGAPAKNDECENTPGEELERRYGRLFLTSSVSGGSVGVRHLVVNANTLKAGKDWVDQTAGWEALSPVVGWGLFHDLPAFMLGLPLNPDHCDEREEVWCRIHADRALVQEAAVAGGERGAIDAAPEAGVLGQEGPITVFNAAENGAARRVLISPVELAPTPRQRSECIINTGEPINTAIDAHDVLATGTRSREEISLVTAALLSARFPLVAPPARLGVDETKAFDDGVCEQPPLDPVIVRDGGYMENSGVLTIAELLPAVQSVINERSGGPRIWPIVVSIDDDPPKPNELRFEDAPTGALGISKKANSGLLTAGARATIRNCAVPGVNYVRLSPEPHMGAQAATGWEISETTREEDLGESLRSGQASKTLRTLQAILAGEPTSLIPCQVRRR